jgi:hypothetical protein
MCKAYNINRANLYRIKDEMGAEHVSLPSRPG